MSNEQAKHVPGPWKATGRYVGTPNHQSYIAECYDKNHNWSNDEFSLANAALIARAPELLEQVTALTTERDALRDTLQRIAIAYPIVAGPNTCPPSPHACDKCEIYFLLDEYKAHE